MSRCLTSRRAILVGFAAASTVPASIGLAYPGVGSSPDATLIRDCDEARRLWTETDSRALIEDWSDERCDQNTAAVFALTERAAAIPAHTLAGLRAKAQLASRHFEPVFEGQERDFSERLLDSLLADLIGQGGRA